MPTPKKQVQEVLNRLPENCTLEGIQYHLSVANKIRQRVEQADAGHAIPHSEAVSRLKEWFVPEGCSSFGKLRGEA